MPLTIGNALALFAQRHLAKAAGQLEVSLQRLGSGLRINGARDDPAGLAMAEGLNMESRLYAQGVRNVNDALSLLSVADGAMAELTSIVLRQTELAEQAANGVFSDSQRETLNAEVQALSQEFNRIVASTEFNGRKIFTNDGFGLTSIQIGRGSGGDDSISFDLGTIQTNSLGEATFTDNGIISEAFTREAVTADVNGDGNTDIVTSHSSSGAYVSVLLGNGDGTFSSALTFATGGTPKGIGLGDLDGDQKLDLVAADYTDDTVSILYGNGDGTFEARSILAGGDGPKGVVITDLNNDSLNDIAVSDEYSHTVSLYFSNGNGTFAARQTFSGINNPFDIIAADFDGDNKRDLAVVNVGVGSIRVYLGNGNGTFGADRRFYVGSSPYALAASDLNSDGILDLVSANYNGNSVSMLIGNGNGTFQSQITLSGFGRPTDIRVADFNNDGLSDLLVTENQDGVVSVLYGNGNATFGARVTYDAGVTPYWAVPGDFNGDAALDFVTGDLGTEGTRVYLGSLSVTTLDGAQDSIDYLRDLLDTLILERATIGALQSRFEYASRHLDAMRAATSAAFSRIMDVDVAEETANMVRQQILQQAAVAMLAHSGLQSKTVLDLLGA